MAERISSRLRWLGQRPQRAWLWPALAAFIGLIASASALFRSAPSTVAVVPPGYAALVNQKGILMSDYQQQAATENSTDFSQVTPEQRARVLREMIDEELLVQRALTLDLPETTTEVRDAMSSAVNAQAAAPLLAIEPTDAQLRAYYDAHRGEYSATGSMTVHDLLLRVGGYQNIDQSSAQAETDAGEAVYQLRAGASIDYVMEHFGLVDSGRSDNTDQFDFAAKIHLGDKLYAIASNMTDGQVSDPIADSDGVHILIMDRRQAPKLADFSSVRDKVYSAFRQQQTRDADAQNLKLLRRDAQILLAPGQHQ